MLLGRDHELACLARHLTAIRSGAGTALALVGEPGIGKTALLQWAAAEARGMRVLRATGVESEVELAFSGLAELCLPLFAHLDEIPPPQPTAGARSCRCPARPPARARCPHRSGCR